MSIVVSRKGPANSGGLRSSADSRNSVYEARWLLIPVFMLAIILAAADLFA